MCTGNANLVLGQHKIARAISINNSTIEIIMCSLKMSFEIVTAWKIRPDQHTRSHVPFGEVSKFVVATDVAFQPHVCP